MGGMYQSIVGKIVAFVVAADESRPEEGIEFADPKSALKSPDSLDGGYYFKKLQLPSGQIEYDPGFNDRTVLGDVMYGLRCSGCGKRTWWQKRYDYDSRNFCDECTAHEHSDADISEIEYYDREE